MRSTSRAEIRSKLSNYAFRHWKNPLRRDTNQRYVRVYLHCSEVVPASMRDTERHNVAHEFCPIDPDIARAAVDVKVRKCRGYGYVHSLIHVHEACVREKDFSILALLRSRVPTP